RALVGTSGAVARPALGFTRGERHRGGLPVPVAQHGAKAESELKMLVLHGRSFPSPSYSRGKTGEGYLLLGSLASTSFGTLGEVVRKKKDARTFVRPGLSTGNPTSGAERRRRNPVDRTDTAELLPTPPASSTSEAPPRARQPHAPGGSRELLSLA